MLESAPNNPLSLAHGRIVFMKPVPGTKKVRDGCSSTWVGALREMPTIVMRYSNEAGLPRWH